MIWMYLTLLYQTGKNCNFSFKKVNVNKVNYVQFQTMICKPFM